MNTLQKIVFFLFRPMNIALQRVRGEPKRKYEYVIKFEDGSVIDSFPEHVLQPPKPGDIGKRLDARNRPRT